MPATIGENQIHEVILTPPFDTSGRTIEMHYVAPDGTVTKGGTAPGAAPDTEVVVMTDLAGQGITPGYYEVEAHYDDLGTLRQLELCGETHVKVLDAETVP